MGKRPGGVTLAPLLSVPICRHLIINHKQTKPDAGYSAEFKLHLKWFMLFSIEAEYPHCTTTNIRR